MSVLYGSQMQSNGNIPPCYFPGVYTIYHVDGREAYVFGKFHIQFLLFIFIAIIKVPTEQYLAPLNFSG